MKKVSIFLATDDNYAKYASVVIKSACAKTSRPLYFGVITKGLSDENKGKLRECAGENEIEFFAIDINKFNGFKVDLYLKYITIETCFRYLIPELRPDLDKVLYLDCDVVCMDDLAKIFDADISGVYAGVVPESKRGAYWCAGVILLNCEKCRRDNIVERLFERTKRLNGVSKFLDQDALNDVFGDRVKALDFRWQIMPSYFNVKSGLSDAELDDVVLNAGIAHLCANDKPWDVPRGIVSNPFAQVFFHYLRRTPYADEEARI
ncbi:MAG: glycosyltransferase family 8 protein, partial [Opitutales bacterium]|nr:glycosyltransferase family 8 protein [Opitutales bacterium]